MQNRSSFAPESHYATSGAVVKPKITFCNEMLMWLETTIHFPSTQKPSQINKIDSSSDVTNLGGEVDIAATCWVVAWVLPAFSSQCVS